VHGRSTILAFPFSRNCFPQPQNDDDPAFLSHAVTDRDWKYSQLRSCSLFAAPDDFLVLVAARALIGFCVVAALSKYSHCFSFSREYRPSAVALAN
jgi:hypothetical protein